MVNLGKIKGTPRRMEMEATTVLGAVVQHLMERRRTARMGQMDGTKSRGGSSTKTIQMESRSSSQSIILGLLKALEHQLELNVRNLTRHWQGQFKIERREEEFRNSALYVYIRQRRWRTSCGHAENSGTIENEL